MWCKHNNDVPRLPVTSKSVEQQQNNSSLRSISPWKISTADTKKLVVLLHMSYIYDIICKITERAKDHQKHRTNLRTLGRSPQTKRSAKHGWLSVYPPHRIDLPSLFTRRVALSSVMDDRWPCGHCCAVSHIIKTSVPPIVS